MERRWTTRTQLNLDVDVRFTGGELAGCKTRDIGLGGVCLTEGGEQLPNDAQVELIFKVNASSAVQEYALRAKVVRLADDCVGLMFRDFDATAFRSLQKVMRVKEAV